MKAPVGTIVYLLAGYDELKHYLECVVQGTGFSESYTYVQFGDNVSKNIPDFLLRTEDKLEKDVPIFVLK